MRPRAELCAGIGLPGWYAGLVVMLALVACASGASAATLVVNVSRADGKPLAGAVVLLHGPPGSRRPPAASFVVDQVNQTFTPDLIVMPVGSSVTFPNSDKVSHQVYSFSPARRFQLPLYRGAPYPPITFTETGIVTLGCNIHDDMIAYLVVTDATAFGRTAADGTWNSAELPADDYRIEVWHPRLREATDLLRHSVRLTAAQSGSLDVKLMRTLRPERLGHMPRSWSDY